MGESKSHKSKIDKREISIQSKNSTLSKKWIGFFLVFMLNIFASQSYALNAADFFNRGKKALEGTIATVFEKKEENELINAWFSNSSFNSLDGVEKLLLFSIILIGTVLFCVLFTLTMRFILFKLKIKTNSFSTSSSSNSFNRSNPKTTKLRYAMVLDNTPIASGNTEVPAFFGVPNVETRIPEKAIEEDWETIAIRDFNQKFNGSQKAENNQDNFQDALTKNLESENETLVLPEILQDDHALIDTIMEHHINLPLSDPSPAFSVLLKDDEITLKLDLAQTYIEIDDRENAILLLEEVLTKGNSIEKGEAKKLLTKLNVNG